MKSKRARSIYGTLSVCGFVNKYYAPGACTSVDAIRLLFDSYSKRVPPFHIRDANQDRSQYTSKWALNIAIVPWLPRSTACWELYPKSVGISTKPHHSAPLGQRSQQHRAAPPPNVHSTYTPLGSGINHCRTCGRTSVEYQCRRAPCDVQIKFL